MIGTPVTKDANRRLEHLIAVLNHVVHGKRFEKLSDDEHQLAFEDLETAVAEVETRKVTKLRQVEVPHDHGLSMADAVWRN